MHSSAFAKVAPCIAERCNNLPLDQNRSADFRRGVGCPGSADGKCGQRRGQHKATRPVAKRSRPDPKLHSDVPKFTFPTR